MFPIHLTENLQKPCVHQENVDFVTSRLSNYAIGKPSQTITNIRKSYIRRLRFCKSIRSKYLRKPSVQKETDDFQADHRQSHSFSKSAQIVCIQRFGAQLLPIHSTENLQKPSQGKRGFRNIKAEQLCNFQANKKHYIHKDIVHFTTSILQNNSIGMLTKTLLTEGKLQFSGRPWLNIQLLQICPNRLYTTFWCTIAPYTLDWKLAKTLCTQGKAWIS
jgi:hypothetical protein